MPRTRSRLISRAALRILGHLCGVPALPDQGYRHALRVQVTALRVAPDDLTLSFHLFPPRGLQLALLGLLVYRLGLGVVAPLLGIGHFVPPSIPSPRGSPRR